MAYNFSLDRSNYGKVAEQSVVNWMSKNLVNFEWLNGTKDAKKSYDIIAYDVDNIKRKIDVKRTYESNMNTIHFKIANENGDKDNPNAGLFWKDNESDTYFFVNSNSCADAWQVGTNTLRRLVKEKKCSFTRYTDDTLWATINLMFIPDEEKIYYSLLDK